GVFNRMYDKFFKRHDIPLKIKIRAFNACVMPVLLYGAETWSITRTLEKKLEAAENKWFRRLLRVGYKEHVTNADKEKDKPKVSHRCHQEEKNEMGWACDQNGRQKTNQGNAPV